MTGLSGDFEKETIREAEGRSRPEGLECCCHDIVVLENQILVVQELLDGHANLRGITLIDSGQHPYRLGQCEKRHPRARYDEFIGQANLLGIVAGQNAHQDVRVNGAHVSFGYISGSRPSTLPLFEASAILREIRSD